MNVTEETVWVVPSNHVVTSGGKAADGTTYDAQHPQSPHGVLFRSQQAANEAVEAWVRLLAEKIPEEISGGPMIFMSEDDVRRYLPEAHSKVGNLFSLRMKVDGRFYDRWEKRAEITRICWEEDGELRVYARVWYRLMGASRVKATTSDGREIWVDPIEPSPVTEWLPVRHKPAERADPMLEPVECVSWGVAAKKKTLRWGD